MRRPEGRLISTSIEPEYARSSDRLYSDISRPLKDDAYPLGSEKLKMQRLKEDYL